MQNNTYLIGEIGQNHNGSVDIAKVIIDLISRPIHDDVFGNKLKGMDAVKLTKRDLKQELSQSQMDRIYNNVNSFGKTYGEHRKFLELNDKEHYEIYKHAKEKGLEFVETLCAVGCLSIFKYFSPDKLKVASRDLTNLPLIEALAETNIPIILSTGMSGQTELNDALDIISKYHENISILHCVSQYPTKPKNVNLRTIKFLKNNYSNYSIGYSDHTIGISIPIAAVSLGAEIIEKHITLDRGMKGTDHQCSLGPDGVKRMVRDIRTLNLSLGQEKMYIVDETKDIKNKLERSIATNKSLKKGHVLKNSDLHLLSPGDGFKWSHISKVLNKTLKVDLGKDEIIYENLIK